MKVYKHTYILQHIFYNILLLIKTKFINPQKQETTS